MTYDLQKGNSLILGNGSRPLPDVARRMSSPFDNPSRSTRDWLTNLFGDARAFLSPSMWVMAGAGLLGGTMNVQSPGEAIGGLGAGAALGFTFGGLPGAAIGAGAAGILELAGQFLPRNPYATMPEMPEPSNLSASLVGSGALAGSLLGPGGSTIGAGIGGAIDLARQPHSFWEGVKTMLVDKPASLTKMGQGLFAPYTSGVEAYENYWYEHPGFALLDLVTAGETAVKGVMLLRAPQAARTATALEAAQKATTAIKG